MTAAPPDGRVVADVVIPVYNEGRHIRAVLDSLKTAAHPLRVLICYDFDDDDTLTALAGYDPSPLAVVPVRNRGQGVLAAVLTGFQAATAPFVITYPGDDDYSGGRVDELVRLALAGHDVVCASRFMPGGSMQRCPLLKAILVRAGALVMYYVARVPTRDATHALRLFSRRVLDRVPVESTTGFAFSMELLVKTHRLGWPIAETPFLWRERRIGTSRFRVLAWLPQYLRWVGYGLATTWLGKSAADVTLRDNVQVLPQP